MVFISVSKIQFESKSQQCLGNGWKVYGCLSVCQRYNLKANHNRNNDCDKWALGVYQCVKDTIWKQITTLACLIALACWVFISVSKIQFESKSQLVPKPKYFCEWCLSVCQRYNLKANHNNSRIVSVKTSGVYQCVKDTIWKQITTKVWSNNQSLMVFISVSKIQFESKSQHSLPIKKFTVRCLSVCQRYNLKANHNSWLLWEIKDSGVYQCVKDTIWKQITTQEALSFQMARVFISVSKIQFESKSQRVVVLKF